MMFVSLVFSGFFISDDVDAAGINANKEIADTNARILKSIIQLYSNLTHWLYRRCFFTIAGQI